MPSLAGLGRSGLWQVDIDDEGEADHPHAWSITLSHPCCYVQWGLSGLVKLHELVSHLTNPKLVDQMFHFPASGEAELLIGVVQGRLLVRVARSGQIGRDKFDWMAETLLGLEEVEHLAVAIGDALREADSS
jgi:hypothetical protein